MSRTAPTKDNLVDAIAACLKQDGVVGGYVDGRVGRVETFEDVPRCIEIGLTIEEPTSEVPRGWDLVTIHLWSRSGNPEVAQSVLDAAEKAMAAMDRQLVLEREYTEVRYDERVSSFHGILRMRLSRGTSMGLSRGEKRAGN